MICGLLRIKSSVMYGMGNKGGRYYAFIPCHKIPCCQNEYKILSKVNPTHYTTDIYVVVELTGEDKGYVVEVIGPQGIYENEIKARIYANQLYFPTYKTVSVIKETQQQIEQYPDNYCDLSQLFVFSIDPQGCLDIDDALSIVNMGNDTYEIGIHIADVDYYVKAGKYIDSQAKTRISSIYIDTQVGNIEHMLPKQLSQNQCSLLENTKRPCLSLILTVNTQGHIINYKFISCLIINKHNWTYDYANNLINGNKNHVIKTLYSLSCGIHNYLKLSTSLNYGIDKAHDLVETLMITANIYCAKYLLQGGLPVIIRSHSSSPCNSVSSEIEQIMLKYQQHKAYYKVATNETTDDVVHMGIGGHIYAHFTSPIRRYVDLVNHRLIKSIINANSSLCNIDIDMIRNITNTANDINQHIKSLDKQIKYLKLMTNLQQDNGNEYTFIEGYIVDLSDHKIKVYIPQYQLFKTIKGTSEGKELKLYDKIELKVVSIPTNPKFSDKIHISIK